MIGVHLMATPKQNCTRYIIAWFLIFAAAFIPRPVVAKVPETEKQFDARMKFLEDEVKRTRPDVIWVNAEEYAKGLRK